MRRGWVLATAAVALFPSLAHADSDGYYCIGPGFVAYEMSSSGAASGHWLHIVRVSAAKGIVRLPPIALPEFQVHGMTCRENGCRSGWLDNPSQCLAGLQRAGDRHIDRRRAESQGRATAEPGHVSATGGDGHPERRVSRGVPVGHC
jgi:hypothetical protein